MKAPLTLLYLLMNLPGQEQEPPLGVDPNHEEEAGNKEEEGEEEGGEEEGGRQGGGWGLLLQQEDCQAAEAEQELQESLQ